MYDKKERIKERERNPKETSNQLILYNIVVLILLPFHMREPCDCLIFLPLPTTKAWKIVHICLSWIVDET